MPTAKDSSARRRDGHGARRTVGMSSRAGGLFHRREGDAIFFAGMLGCAGFVVGGGAGPVGALVGVVWGALVGWTIGWHQRDKVRR